MILGSAGALSLGAGMYESLSNKGEPCEALRPEISIWAFRILAQGFVRKGFPGFRVYLNVDCGSLVSW